MSRSYPGEITFKMETPPSPSYRIFRDKHGIPQFEPKRGTQALKDALIYSFPTLETELQLMQAALRKFFDSEKGSTFVFELPERDLQTSLVKKLDVPTTVLQSSKASLRSWKVSRASRTPSRPSSRASSRAPSRASSRCETPVSFAENGGTMTTWMLSNGQELEKRKRQPYDAVKRRKVAENRGNACEKHRASKTACDPEECPQNKLYGRNAGRPRRESEVSAYDSPQPATPVTEQTIFAPTIATPSNHHELDAFFDSMDIEEMPLKALPSQQNAVAYNNPWTIPNETESSSWNATMTDLCMESMPALPNLPNVLSGTMSEHLPTNTVQQGFVATDLHVVPEEAHHEDLLSAPATSVVIDRVSSDDPFMGWANKRASNLADEYGWVLSHVEAL